MKSLAVSMLTVLSLAPAAWAAQPLITDDTGTQGKGRSQRQHRAPSNPADRIENKNILPISARRQDSQDSCVACDKRKNGMLEGQPHYAGQGKPGHGDGRATRMRQDKGCGPFLDLRRECQKVPDHTTAFGDERHLGEGQRRREAWIEGDVEQRWSCNERRGRLNEIKRAQ